MIKKTSIIIVYLLYGVVYGQAFKPIDYLTEINNHNLSKLWTIKEIKTELEGDTSLMCRNEPLGFIGEDYQRFYIHFTSVIKHSKHALEYFVYGKTRVKSNICVFQGMIKILESKIYKEIQATKHGFVSGSYEFYEDSEQKGSGFFQGTFKTFFVIDNSGNIQYDAIEFISDGFENNQFEGIWTSYKSKTSKKCNWGDYRIPDSGDLDIGVAEFAVNEKYISNGWMDYEPRYDIQNISIEKSQANENIKWWMDK